MIHAAIEDQMTEDVYAILSELLARPDYNKAITISAFSRRIVRQLDAVDNYITNIKFRADRASSDASAR